MIRVVIYSYLILIYLVQIPDRRLDDDDDSGDDDDDVSSDTSSTTNIEEIRDDDDKIVQVRPCQRHDRSRV